MKFFDRFKSKPEFESELESESTSETSTESKPELTPDIQPETTIEATTETSRKVNAEPVSSCSDQSQSAQPFDSKAAVTSQAAQTEQPAHLNNDSITTRNANQEAHIDERLDTESLRQDTSDTTTEKPSEGSDSGFFSRLKKGLKRTSSSFAGGMGTIFLGKKEIDDELIDDLETQLLLADVGIEATQEIMDRLAQRVSRKELVDSDALYKALQQELTVLLEPSVQPLVIDSTKSPYVILMVGVNGVGKTTTIGKLAKRFQAEGKNVMLAAGDTFRAAAVEQLQVWGDRNNVPVIAQHTGADSASVIFDAVKAAQSRHVDVLIADTAGRLHNKDNLMEELRKVVRVMGKLDNTAPHEVMLVLDAGTGQNALAQARAFQDVVGVSGITLTKLDGTAKGGIIFAISKQLQLPIRYIGVGEQVDDLRTFAAEDFVEALFDDEE